MWSFLSVRIFTFLISNFEIGLTKKRLQRLGVCHSFFRKIKYYIQNNSKLFLNELFNVDNSYLKVSEKLVNGTVNVFLVNLHLQGGISDSELYPLNLHVFIQKWMKYPYFVFISWINDYFHNCDNVLERIKRKCSEKSTLV